MNLNKQELVFLPISYHEYLNSYTVYIFIKIITMCCVWITDMIMIMVGSLYVYHVTIRIVYITYLYVDLCTYLLVYQKMNDIILECAVDYYCIVINK